jgi:diacylglycerol kinase family enzyme
MQRAALFPAKMPVIVNRAAGLGHSKPELERLQRLFQEAGIDADLSSVGSGGEIAELARRALKHRPPVLVAAGGDGTLNTVAAVVRETDTALGIVPLGTLNHFARDLGVPLERADAVRAIAAGRRVAVDIGEVNGTCFLNNSSLGLYPDIVRERARQQRRLGRGRRSAMLWATLAALDRSPLLDLRLQLEHREQLCRAPFVFVGNNQYQMEGFDIGTRARLDAGYLSIYTTQCSSRGGLLTLALHALFGRLRQAEDFTALSATALRVESRRKRLLVATDGEISLMHTPLEFRIRPRALHVIVP